MGNTFSGWHGRRSSRPYFDELVRISVADCKRYPAGDILFSWRGGLVTVRKIIIPVGCIQNAPRLQCARCGKACKVLYAASGKACCRLCAGARYRSTSTGATARAYIAGLKSFRRWKFDIKRPGGKPKWMRWPTFEKREAEAFAAMPAIEHVENAPYVTLERVERRGKRRKPR